MINGVRNCTMKKIALRITCADPEGDRVHNPPKLQK